MYSSSDEFPRTGTWLARSVSAGDADDQSEIDESDNLSSVNITDEV